MNAFEEHFVRRAIAALKRIDWSNPHDAAGCTGEAQGHLESIVPPFRCLAVRTFLEKHPQPAALQG